VRRCFAESVVPAVERATRAMLAQTEAALGASLKEHHDAVQQHLAQALAAHTAATAAAAAAAAKVRFLPCLPRPAQGNFHPPFSFCYHLCWMLVSLRLMLPFAPPILLQEAGQPGQPGWTGQPQAGQLNGLPRQVSLHPCPCTTGAVELFGACGGTSDSEPCHWPLPQSHCHSHTATVTPPQSHSHSHTATVTLPQSPVFPFPFPFAQALSLEHVEAALDPSIEISRLLEAKQYEAAITKVLTLADTAFLSWFCLQVGPPPPTPPYYPAVVRLPSSLLLSLRAHDTVLYKLSSSHATAAGYRPGVERRRECVQCLGRSR